MRDARGDSGGPQTAGPLLEVDGLVVHFPARRSVFGRVKAVVHAVDGVSFTLRAGETLALVGESGSGKTTAARAVAGLTKITAGTVRFEGHDVSPALRRAGRRGQAALARDIQMLYQDPYSSLSPRLTVHDIVAEPLWAHEGKAAPGQEQHVVDLLEMVGLGTQHLWRRPHEFSGGQCQRIAVARALALRPRLLILDEPTSALDVSVQARILKLLDRLQRELDLAYLLVAHDMAVVRATAARVAVMYLGQIVEYGPSDLVLDRPEHPYTQALLRSIPSPDPKRRSGVIALEGDVPSAVDPPAGCRFHTRCADRGQDCAEGPPALVELAPGHFAACHRLAPRTDAAPESG